MYKLNRGSLRRLYLDKLLFDLSDCLTGRILDIGGKKKNKRGSFRPSENLKIEYLNIDESTEPDYLVSADSMHFFGADEFDSFLMIEVLEHLSAPEKVIAEIRRVLRSGGLGVISIPFLYPIHGDPHDYQRYTIDKLKMLLNSNGFDVIKIVEMGGLASVIHDLLWSYNWRINLKILRRINSLLISFFSPIAIFMDRYIFREKRFITTGWIMLVKKI
jgi:SAM-dependent methyltransferase